MTTAAQKLFEELLSTADPEDELTTYPTGSQSFGVPAVNFDPGRYRCAACLRKCTAKPRKRWSRIDDDPLAASLHPEGGSRRRVNGIDHQLEAVSAELDQLPPEVKKYVLKTGGTFNWRPIAGWDQLSAHAFGIAIDIDPDYSDYWHWNIGGDHGKLIPSKTELTTKNGWGFF